MTCVIFKQQHLNLPQIPTTVICNSIWHSNIPSATKNPYTCNASFKMALKYFLSAY